MYHHIKQECSVCHSNRYETFQRERGVSGTRCLDCGHENVATIATTNDNNGQIICPSSDTRGTF